MASASKVPKLGIPINHNTHQDNLENPIIPGVSEVSSALKYFYKSTFKNIDELQPPLISGSMVNVLTKFVDLCTIDAVSVFKDISIVDREQYCKRQESYKAISYDKLLEKEASLILITGIAGIGKTWLLRKILLDWSNSLESKNLGLVFYLECKRLNNCQNISNINDLLNLFYKDILNNFDISNVMSSVMFIVDGLDEFIYFDELIYSYSISNFYFKNQNTKVLKQILDCKVVVAGRLGAIWRYESIVAEKTIKVIIQVIGFSEAGITQYIEKNVINEAKERVKIVLEEYQIAKKMASVPFFLSSLCKILEQKSDCNVLTMTDLYASIFIYFWQRHINKSNTPVYKIMKNDDNMSNFKNLCKVASYLFTENKITFSREEVSLTKFKFNGFIESIETNFGYRYQFVHLTFLDFCAAVYAYNNLTCKDIKSSKKYNNLLPILCGLLNKNKESFIQFLTNPQPDLSVYDIYYKVQTQRKEPLKYILDLIPEESSFFFNRRKVFMECFYESQATMTESLVALIDDDLSQITIGNENFYESSCQKYFVEHFVNSGGKLH